MSSISCNNKVIISRQSRKLTKDSVGRMVVTDLKDNNPMNFNIAEYCRSLEYECTRYKDPPRDWEGYRILSTIAQTAAKPLEKVVFMWKILI